MQQQVIKNHLFNRLEEITEASSSNVFIVKDGVISTPIDNQILPGITRWLILNILHSYSDFKVQERINGKDELLDADEVWITSATKEGPVVKVNGKLVGDGKPGAVWQQQSLFTKHKFDY